MSAYVLAFGKRTAPTSPTTIVAMAPSGPNITQSTMAIASPIRILGNSFIGASDAIPMRGNGATWGQYV